MKHEKSAGAVLFNVILKKFLLLYRKKRDHYKGGWGFPKGLIEKGEDVNTAANREIAEETGVTNIRFAPEFEQKITYEYEKKGELIQKTVTFLLATTESMDAKVSSEHDKVEWFSYLQAFDLLTFDNSKEVLQKASFQLIKLGHSLLAEE